MLDNVDSVGAIDVLARVQKIREAPLNQSRQGLPVVGEFIEP